MNNPVLQDTKFYNTQHLITLCGDLVQRISQESRICRKAVVKKAYTEFHQNPTPGLVTHSLQQKYRRMDTDCTLDFLSSTS